MSTTTTTTTQQPSITIPEIGAVVAGTVKCALSNRDKGNKRYGVIVRLAGGAEGLLHVAEMKGGSFGARNKRVDSLKEGDAVEVEVIDVKPDGKRTRIALSEKSLQNRAILEQLGERTEVEGVVAAVKDFGLIVTIVGGVADGVDALLHVSQLPGASPKERDRQLTLIAVGSSIRAEVTAVETDEDNNLRIKLSQQAAARRQAAARYGAGSKHTGSIVKKGDRGFLVSFGVLQGFLAYDDACSDKLKVGDRVSAIVTAVGSDGQLTLSRRSLR